MSDQPPAAPSGANMTNPYPIKAQPHRPIEAQFPHLIACADKRIAAARAEEREECARVSDKQEGPYQIGEGTPCSCGERVAAAIRARGGERA